MSLSCDCSSYEPKEGDIVCREGYYDFEPLRTSKREICCSCNELIDIGAFSVKFDMYKVPEDDEEVEIYGEDGEIPVDPSYLCEKCGEIYLNLTELGFCVWIEDDMRKLLKEYQEYYAGPKL